MKFRYYITNLFTGCIEGSNDDKWVNELAVSEDFFIADTETGEWISSGKRIPIEESK